MSLTEQSRIVASEEQVSCELGAEVAILSLKNGVYYGLNPVGARIWKLIQTPRTFGEIRLILLTEYDVGSLQLEADIEALLHDLDELCLVEVEQE